MNGFVKSSLIFLAGAALGAFGYKKYLDYKENRLPEYEEIVEPDEGIIDDDNDIVEEKEIKREVNANIEPVSRISSVEQEEYKRLLDELKYNSQNEEEDIVEEDDTAIVLRRNEHVVDTSIPYNISPEEFEEDDYESDEYTMYADGYVTDTYGMPLSPEDIETTIGTQYASYFGSYDDDQIWIRNERLHMDFSVIRDMDRFVDVAPPRVRRMVGL